MSARVRKVRALPKMQPKRADGPESGTTNRKLQAYTEEIYIVATVEDILMRKGSDVIGTMTSTTVSDAVQKMVYANVGCLLIQQEERALGIFTERDLLRRVIAKGKDPNTTLIAEVMTSPVQTCQAHDDVEKCAILLDENQFRHLVVVDNEEPVGVISLRDLIFALHVNA